MPDIATIESVTRSFCTFRADQRLYGIDVTHLREVSTQVATTRVPQAPPAIRGLANLRSRVYLVIDLRPLLGLAPADCTMDSRLIILKSEFAEDVGILVDCGGDIVKVRESEIESAASPHSDASGDAARSLTSGVCKLEAELMVILDTAAIVSEVGRQTRTTSGPSAATQMKETTL